MIRSLRSKPVFASAPQHEYARGVAEGKQQVLSELLAWQSLARNQAVTSTNSIESYALGKAADAVSAIIQNLKKELKIDTRSC